MENEKLRPDEDELMEAEENCRKALKTVARAIFMRLVVTVLLLLALVKSAGELWVMGLMAFVLIINIGGSLPLVTELKKQRRKLKEILDQYE